jgi:hypothetical protein
MTHREMCREAARWLLNQRNLFASAYEVTFDGGVADAMGVSEPDPCAGIELRIGEYARTRAIRDAKAARRLARKKGEAITAPLFGSLPAPSEPAWAAATRTRRAKAAPLPVVAVVECKRTRSDWLADAREQKLRRYEPASSECWLLVMPDVLALPEEMAQSREHVCARLDGDGLPAHWGVLVLDAVRGGTWQAWRARDARPHRVVTDWEVVGWAGRMLRSMAYRTLTGAVPMVEAEPPASRSA